MPNDSVGKICYKISNEKRPIYPVVYALGFLSALLRIVDVDTAADWVARKGLRLTYEIQFQGDNDGET